jgi:peptide/nickel transport system substrate-binding protein
VARSHLGSSVPFHTAEHDVYYPADPEMANTMLDEAGFKQGADGVRFSLRLRNAVGTPAHDRTAETIRSNLAKVGINVEIISSDSAAFLSKTFEEHDFDLALQLFTTGPDPTLSVPHRYRESAIGGLYQNAGSFVDPELEDIFNREYTETDVAKRGELWKRAQAILMDGLPALPLYESPVVQYHSSKFCDVVATAMGYLDTRERAYLAPEGGCD